MSLVACFKARQVLGMKPIGSIMLELINRGFDKKRAFKVALKQVVDECKKEPEKICSMGAKLVGGLTYKECVKHLLKYEYEE
jgi:hypothetical protein